MYMYIAKWTDYLEAYSHKVGEIKIMPQRMAIVDSTYTAILHLDIMQTSIGVLLCYTVRNPRYCTLPSILVYFSLRLKMSSHRYEIPTPDIHMLRTYTFINIH